VCYIVTLTMINLMHKITKTDDATTNDQTRPP